MPHRENVSLLRTMKRWGTIIVAFLLGALLSSGGWAWYSFKRQTELAVFHVTMLHGQASVGEQILTHLESPDPIIERRLTFAASNMVARFPGDLDAWDREFPYLQAKRRYAKEAVKFEQFMRARQAKAATNAVAKDTK